MKKKYMPLMAAGVMLSLLAAQTPVLAQEEENLSHWDLNKEREKRYEEAEKRRAEEEKKRQKEIIQKIGKEKIDERYTQEKPKAPKEMVINTERYNYFSERPVMKATKKDRRETKVYSQDVTHETKIINDQKSYRDRLKTLDTKVPLKDGYIVEKSITLDQRKIPGQLIQDIRTLRGQVWDIDEGKLDILPPIYDPKTGQKIEGVWINGKRLKEALAGQGIHSKEAYMKAAEWNRDLENLAIQNMAEYSNDYNSPRAYTSSATAAGTQADARVYLYRDNFNWLGNYGEELQQLIQNYGIDEYSHNDSSDENKQRSLIYTALNPVYHSYAYAAVSDMHSRYKFILASQQKATDTSSSNYQGEFVVPVSFSKKPPITILQVEKLYVGTPHQLRIECDYLAVKNYKGKFYSSDPNILTVDEGGLITPKKEGKAQIICDENGVPKTFNVEVLPALKVVDEMYQTSPYSNPHPNHPKIIYSDDLDEGEERILQAFKPSVSYQMLRKVVDSTGEVLKEEVYSKGEFEGQEEIIKRGRKKKAPEHKPDNSPHDKPDNSTNGFVLFAPPYQSHEGYFEVMPGYYVKLEPKYEDQVTRINEKDHAVIVKATTALAVGEHRVLQVGKNAYTEITTRVYKDDHQQILKSQELSRREELGQALIVEVGIGSSSQKATLPAEHQNVNLSDNLPKAKEPETLSTASPLVASHPTNPEIQEESAQLNTQQVLSPGEVNPLEKQRERKDKEILVADRKEIQPDRERPNQSAIEKESHKAEKKTFRSKKENPTDKGSEILVPSRKKKNEPLKDQQRQREVRTTESTQGSRAPLSSPFHEERKTLPHTGAQDLPLALGISLASFGCLFMIPQKKRKRE
ncbi:hypothetical protein CYJ27_02020 [Aerococcus christensenii]|uniref:LPXTG-motif protein cell wall anchor domain protein n=1 Tax=Aerococcus christensenii TaxID=87541 RepID=A0A2I1K9I7_9LACT|nr:hypothetical protein [Aerococcus christensenii]PKY92235.1 hypothetical protein CYJ27_02020 [Aerococcus christensenii]